MVVMKLKNEMDSPKYMKVCYRIMRNYVVWKVSDTVLEMHYRIMRNSVVWTISDTVMNEDSRIT